MKVMIVSDSHGSIANLKHALGFAKKTGVKAIIHCGDWDSVKAVKTVLSFEVPLYSVLGNADIDPEIGKMPEVRSKRFDRTFLRFSLDGKKIGVTHNIKYLTSNISHLDILFCGHTHRQSEIIKNGIRVVNPGALENGIEFAVYDTNTNKVEFIHE